MIAGGEAFEVDRLIYATGFDLNSVDMAPRNGFEIFGRGGRSLSDKWRPEVATCSMSSTDRARAGASSARATIGAWPRATEVARPAPEGL